MNSDIDETEVDTATKQAVNDRDSRGRFAPGNTPSTGFHTHSERRNNGKWTKEESISYWYNKLGRMSDDEYDNFRPKNQNQRIAQARIVMALGTDELALKATKEITDRVEGKPKQDLDMNIESDNAVPLIKGFVIPTLPEHFIDKDIIEQMGELLRLCTMKSQPT